jgi:hypothetical protein
MTINAIVDRIVTEKLELRIRSDTFHDRPLVRVEVYEGDHIKVAANGVLFENALQVLAQVLGVAPDESLSDSTGRKVPVFIRRRPNDDDTADNYDSEGTVPKQKDPE